MNHAKKAEGSERGFFSTKTNLSSALPVDDNLAAMNSGNDGIIENGPLTLRISRLGNLSFVVCRSRQMDLRSGGGWVRLPHLYRVLHRYLPIRYPPKAEYISAFDTHRLLINIDFWE
jgi:hypothetical protein